jgi:hypothetical protein
MSSWLLGVAAAGLHASCPIGRATYTARDGAGLTASFHDIGKRLGWLSPLALGVQSARTRRTFWFLFDRGAARRINLISTGDVTQAGWRPPLPDGGMRPLGEMPYLAANADLAFDEHVPTAASPAPKYILLPELPEALAHRASPPESVKLAFFQYEGCRHRR